MKVQYKKGVASHLDPESCVASREVCNEALTGDTGRPAMEPRNDKSGTSTLFGQAEDKTKQGVKRESCGGSTRSETLSMPGSYLRRSWEISSAPDGVMSGGAGKGNRNPAIYADEKSDTPIVSRKPSNKDRPAEKVEKRGVAKGSVEEFPACRTLSRGKSDSGTFRRT